MTVYFTLRGIPKGGIQLQQTQVRVAMAQVVMCLELAPPVALHDHVMGGGDACSKEPP